MGNKLYRRVCSVSVGETRIEGLRISFVVKKTDKQEPNTAEIKIYNLSAQTRAKMQKVGEPVILSAGYEGDEAIIFVGDTRSISHIRDGADWVTVVKAGDGERALRYQRVNISESAGAQAKEVIKKAAKQIGLDTGNLDKMVDEYVSEVLPRGVVMSGPVHSTLGPLIRSQGIKWSVQDGKWCLAKEGELSDVEQYILSSDSGLIGSPEHCAADPNVQGSHATIKCTALLLNKVTIDAYHFVRLRSENQKADLVIESIEHRGDTHGSEWYTSLVGRPF